MLVNELTNGNQTYGSVAVAIDGSYATAWYDAQTARVYARQWTSDGLPVGSPFIVASSVAESRPEIALDAQGNMYVAASLHDFQVVLAKFDSAQVFQWQKTIGTIDTGNANGADIFDGRIGLATQADGTSAVVWARTSGYPSIVFGNEFGITEVLYSLVSTSGAISANGYLSVETTPGESTASTHERPRPRVASLGDSSWAFSFTRINDRQVDVKVLRGNTLSSVNAVFTQSSTVNNTSMVSDIASTGGGGFAVAASIPGQSGNMFLKRYGSGNQLTHAQIRINSGAAAPASRPSIIPIDSSTFVASWDANGDSDGSSGVYAATLDLTTAGAAFSSQMTVPTVVANTQALPRIGANGVGTSVIIWSSVGQYPGSDLYAQRFTSLGDTTAPAVTSSSFSVESEPKVTIEFSEPLSPASVTSSDLLVTNRTTNAVFVCTSSVLGPDGRTITFSLPTECTNGDYEFALAAGAVADLAGNTLGAAFQMHGPTTFILRGDANRDRRVDFDDLLTLAQNYGQAGHSHAQGNFDYSTDGLVNFDDLLILAQNYSIALSLAGAEPASKAHRRADNREWGTSGCC